MDISTSFHALTLLAHCGGGAYGDVYYCQDLSGKKMAVKIISKKKLGDVWERELKGVINYRQITENTPSLLQIFHVEEDEENFFYTMESADSLSNTTYIPDTLSARLQKGPIPQTDLYRILSGIFQGIKNIHEAGFAHRDIKPDNILFVKGVPKLADIGLLSSLSNTVSLLAGTLEFIPPEERTSDSSEYTNRAGRKRNDLYAFGKVIYCAVTGNNPDAFPTVPKDLPVTLPVKYFLRLAFQLCNKESACRLDSIEKLEEEIKEIEKKIFSAEIEPFSYQLQYTIKNLLFLSKGGLLLTLRLLRRYWYYALFFLLLGGGTAYMIWKPEPHYDMAKEKTKLYTNEKLGFSIQIPSQWEPRTQAILKSLKKMKTPAKYTEKQWKEIVEKNQQDPGSIVCDFDRKFADMITMAATQNTESFTMPLDEFRYRYRIAVPQPYKKNLEIYDCKKILFSGLTTIFMDYSLIPGTRSVSYYIAKNGGTLIISLIAKNETFQQRHEEVKAALSTLKFIKK